MIRIILILVACLVCTPENLIAQDIARKAHFPGGEIRQLIENRSGHNTCAGFIIELKELRFKRVIRAAEITILEGKHGHELKDAMHWRVNKNQKKLTIKFRHPLADFGSGNVVEVRLERSAFLNAGKSPKNCFEWAILTDVL